MDAREGAIWFFGDHGDPWVVAIMEALQGSWGARRVHCAGDLPERPFDADNPPRLAVLHRLRMTALDCARLADWRDQKAKNAAPALILCVGPYVRYEELDRAACLVDRVLSEATAADVLPGHVARLIEGRRPRDTRREVPEFRIEVAGGTEELARTLVDACTSWGYRAEHVGDLTDGDLARARVAPAQPGERLLTIWEVPVLEEGWCERLAQRALAAGPLVALLGFADRTTVGKAKERGALACLELPCDLDELHDVIERVVERVALESWPLPARLEAPHLLPPRSRRRGAARGVSTPGAVWSDREERPTIS